MVDQTRESIHSDNMYSNYSSDGPVEFQFLASQTKGSTPFVIIHLLRLHRHAPVAKVHPSVPPL